MPNTLDLLPPLNPSGKSLGATIRAAAKRGAANDKPKAQFTVPKMKQLTKLAESKGQVVSGYTVHGDGGFTINTTAPGMSDASGPSEWD